MSPYNDSSFEMHDDWLTPDAADELLDGEIPSAHFADLAGMIHDIRGLEMKTPTPPVRGALAEYIGIGTFGVPDRAPSSGPTDGPAVDSLDLTTDRSPQRRSAFAAISTFGGTLAGKVLLGASVACASIAAAQAAGLIDLPGLHHRGISVVVTVDPAPDLPFADENPADTGPVDKAENDEPGTPGGAPRHVEMPSDVIEHPDMQPPPTEDAAEQTPPPDPGPSAEELAKQKAIAALEAQFHAEKEAIYAAAAAEMEPLHVQKGALIEALNTTLWQLEQARNEAKAPLYAQLETTDNPELRAQIEAELMAIYQQWELDRDAVLAEREPAIHALKTQLAAIETERDAQIAQLRAEFETAIAAL